MDSINTLLKIFTRRSKAEVMFMQAAEARRQRQAVERALLPRPEKPAAGNSGGHS